MKKLIPVPFFYLTYISLIAQNFNGVDHYKTNEFDVAIFSNNKKILSDSLRPFTPTGKEIDIAEEFLGKKLINLDNDTLFEIDRDHRLIYKNLTNYKRQYFGCQNKKGDSILIINCFDEIEEDTIPQKPWHVHNWLKEPICVQDGGADYWSVKFNLNKEILFDFDDECEWWR